MNNTIVITTGDLKQEYDIIEPVCFVETNEVIIGHLNEFVKKYGLNKSKLPELQKYIIVATEELKKRAEEIGADAIVCMRQNVVPTSVHGLVYVHMYGTAVKIK